MANNNLIVEERQRDLGNFIVGRLLPFRKKRQVGPFTFIDHMGPTVLPKGSYIDVDQHPHIGLSTLTYLFEGEIEHRDSEGHIQRIRPGDVGFMTAGKGVVHTERTPKELRDQEELRIHGYQVWVALPSHLEDIDPRFDFYPNSKITQWQDGSLHIKLIAGEAFGKSSALVGFSPLFMLDIHAKDDQILNLRGQLKGELAFVIVRGSIVADEQEIQAGQMLISKSNDQCEIALSKDTQILLFGGEPLKEEPLLLWNFVSHNKEKLKQAKQDWLDRKFPKVSDDDTYIHFPTNKK